MSLTAGADADGISQLVLITGGISRMILNVTPMHSLMVNFFLPACMQKYSQSPWHPHG